MSGRRFTWQLLLGHELGLAFLAGTGFLAWSGRWLMWGIAMGSYLVSGAILRLQDAHRRAE